MDSLNTPGLSKNERAVLARLAAEGRDTLDMRLDGEWLRGISADPTMLVHRMRRKGILHNIERGRYHVNVSGASSPHALIRNLEELALGALERDDRPFYLSWHTALWHHGLIDQQSDTVFVAIENPGGQPSKPQKRPIVAANFKLRFVLLERAKFFGWSDADGVPVASVEKALLDSFDRPEYAGPVWAVANALDTAWRTDKLDVSELVAGALRMNIGALNRRLGFFLELYGIPGADPLLEALGSSWSAVPLQPGTRPDSAGTPFPRNQRWRVYEDPQVISTARSSR
jgi:predicted transcriptional regulator of viral defense system